MAYKVRDLIKGSLRLIGAIAQGEAPTAQEQADALQTLNDMLESWSIEPLLVPAVVREEFALISGQGRYSIGPTPADFVTTRPVDIKQALFVLPGSTPAHEVPLDILTRDEFANIATKTLQSAMPTEIYVEGTAPLENVNLWPVPNAGGTLVLYSSKLIGNFATADATLDLPPGWKKALRYCLAVELAPEYDREVSALVLGGAAEARSLLKIKNSQPKFMEVDPAIPTRRRGFNYLTGE